MDSLQCGSDNISSPSTSLTTAVPINFSEIELLFYRLKNEIDSINQRLYLQSKLLHTIEMAKQRKCRKEGQLIEIDRNYRYWRRKFTRLTKSTKSLESVDLYSILYDLFKYLSTAGIKSESSEGDVILENELIRTSNDMRVKTKESTIAESSPPPPTVTTKTYPCPVYECSFVGRCPAVLKIHQFVHSEEPLFQCQFCGKKLKSKRSLISHASIAHRDQNIYFCDLEDCTQSYSTSALLRKHKIEEHDNLVAFECKKCHKYFKNVYGLDRHLASLHNTVIICDVADCRRTFPTNIRLERHLIREHNIRRSAVNKYIQHSPPTPSQPPKQSGSDPEGRKTNNKSQSFQCAKCSRSFERGYLLKAHQKAVDCTKVFSCHVEDCQERFHKIKLLTEHCLRVHRVAAKFRCTWPGCTYLATQNRGLKSHSRVHTGERPYQCDWPGCEKSFKTHSVLVGHRKQHKNERKYVCKWPDCDYKANTNCTMRSHIRLRHEKTLKRRKKLPEQLPTNIDQLNNIGNEAKS